MSAGRSRRELLRLAGAATLAGSEALAACGDDHTAAPSGAARARHDAAVLNGLLDYEHTLIAAYLAGSRLLDGPALATTRRVLEQERRHTAALRSAIVRRGGRPNAPQSAAEYAQAFPRLTDRRVVLTFAVDLEDRVVRAYEEALPLLTAPELRRAAAAILTNEAQHASVMLEARGRSPIPTAFVTGLE
jgi:hypothetical protein